MDNKSSWSVYEIFDCEGNVIYVGSSKNPKKRFYQHTKTPPSETKSGHGYFYGREDLDFRIVESGFQSLSDAMVFEKELHYTHGLDWGMDKTHDSIRGRKNPKISELKKGKPRSPETIKKMSEKMRGKKHSDETKKKMSDAQKGIPKPSISEKMRGRPQTEEHIRKKAEANRRKDYCTFEGKDYTRKDISELFGISISTLKRWKSGERTCPHNIKFND